MNHATSDKEIIIMGDPIALKSRVINRFKPERDYLDVAFSRDWNTIQLAMEFFMDYTNNRMKNSDETHKIGTAVSELLENAVKYADKGGIRIMLDKKINENTIRLTVFNYTNKKHANRLITRVKQINVSNSLSYYLERMRESIKNKEESAGLGLARVSHETEAKLSARYFGFKRFVEVTAIITLQEEED